MFFCLDYKLTLYLFPLSSWSSVLRPVYVTLVFSTKGQRYLRVGLAMPLFGSLACLRRIVADEGKISPDQVLVSVLYGSVYSLSSAPSPALSSHLLLLQRGSALTEYSIFIIFSI